MKVLALEGVGSKAAPNGLRMPHNGRGDARDYQEAYDRRYYTKDPPVHHAASVPNLSEKARPPLAPSPVVSSYSVHDQTSRLRKEKDKKEKDKKGLFHW
jgi:syntaxin-binding protein 1